MFRFRRRMRADRRGDLARRERAGRDLVEERLEEVMVPAIDQRQVIVRAAEPPAAYRPPKPPPTMTTRCGGAVCMRP